MSVRVALIGAGVMGADHARILAADVPGVHLKVICDASVERACQIAEECGADDTSTDPLAVITRDDVDAVLIASPDETHGPLTLASIAARKPVLCEKPLAPNSVECVEVVNAEVEAGHQFVHVGFMRRFDPSYTEMKAVLRNGTLGRAIMMHNFHRNVEAPANFSGQMAITNSAPHEFDIARFILDIDYVAISVFQPAGTGPNSTGAPVFMVLETTHGQLVNVEINNNASYGYDVRGELVGENGSIFLNAPVYSRLNSGLKSIEWYPADWRPRFAEAYRLQNQDWIRSIQNGIPSLTAANAWDGYCATAIAEAGVLSLKERRRVEVTLPSMPDLYGERKADLGPSGRELAS